jgi:UDP-2,4-diacetamido-2,4,6-trideoxy-beta-L-altropyranose hydrolase
MSLGNLLVRADASVLMGTGHVMRCLALAQAWQDAGGEAVFAVAESSPAIEKRLHTERVQVVPVRTLPGSAQDSMRLRELASHYRPAWVVVDGYQFSAEYHASIRLRDCRVLVVDDCGSCGPNGADVVLNQNLHAREDMYRNMSEDADLLLGPKFAMLRREFGGWRGWRREIAAVGRKILITMGGSDPDNVSAQVCEALRELRVDGVEIRVAVGSSNPHLASLHSIAEKWGGALQVEQNVSDMSELMAWADVAISSAGSTCWEICMLGLPSVLLVLAENQRPVAGELSRLGIAIDASPDEEATREPLCGRVRSLLLANGLRMKMSQRGCELVDGRGGERVVGAMKDFAARGEAGAAHEDMVPMHAVARKHGKGVGV